MARRNVTCAAIGNNYLEQERSSKVSTFSTFNGQQYGIFGYEAAEKCLNKSSMTENQDFGKKQKSGKNEIDENMKYLLDLHEEDTCLKSCTTDCIVSEWGKWSSCQGKCVGVPTGMIKITVIACSY